MWLTSFTQSVTSFADNTTASLYNLYCASILSMCNRNGYCVSSSASTPASTHRFPNLTPLSSSDPEMHKMSVNASAPIEPPPYSQVANKYCFIDFDCDITCLQVSIVCVGTGLTFKLIKHVPLWVCYEELMTRTQKTVVSDCKQIVVYTSMNTKYSSDRLTVQLSRRVKISTCTHQVVCL